MNRPVGFTPQDAKRIGAAVRKSESGGGEGGRSWYPYRPEEGEPVRLGKTTSAWAKGTVATITLYESGTPPNETTATPAATLPNCVNKFVAVATGKWVIVAKGANGYWYLISAEC